MTVRVVAEPLQEPITLAEAKAHLRVDDTSEDALIQTLITAAREAAEDYCARSFALKTYEQVLDAFPLEIPLPFPPVTAVDSVSYVNPAGDTLTLHSSTYALDSESEPGWLLPASTWPEVMEGANVVRIRYMAGATPKRAKQAMLLIIGYLFENRGDTGKNAIPAAATFLLDQLKVYG
jgi:uncharacterized phiE125 gp8 family phage protein